MQRIGLYLNRLCATHWMPMARGCGGTVGSAWEQYTHNTHHVFLYHLDARVPEIFKGRVPAATWDKIEFYLNTSRFKKQGHITCGKCAGECFHENPDPNTDHRLLLGRLSPAVRPRGGADCRSQHEMSLALPLRSAYYVVKSKTYTRVRVPITAHLQLPVLSLKVDIFGLLRLFVSFFFC